MPDLLAHYESVGGDQDRYGQAVITAAMDAARLGHVGPLPPALLRQAASGYLTARLRATDIDTWWDDALAYTARTLTGAVPALEPVPSAEGTGIAGVPGR